MRNSFPVTWTFKKQLGRVISGVFVFFMLTPTGIADEAAECGNMHERLTGKKLDVSRTEDKAKLDACVALAKEGKHAEAAKAFTSDPHFYSVVLKSTFATWTNEDEKTDVPLNDMLATIMGIARDEIDFRRFLYDDLIYTCNGDATVAQVPYSLAGDNNDHYVACEGLGFQGSGIRDALQTSTQTAISNNLFVDTANANAPKQGVPAGVYTTRGFGSVYYNMGTNRAAIRYTLAHFMCEEIDHFKDVTRADYHIRRDVERAPGGSVTVFKVDCKGCHAGMDAMGDAFAYMDWDEETSQMIIDTAVRPKMVRAPVIDEGWVTTDNKWEILWNQGNNTRVGWAFDSGTYTDSKGNTVEYPPKRGQGIKDLAIEFANTTQFPKCISQKVYRKVCVSEFDKLHNNAVVDELTKHFTDSGYKLREAFAKAASMCAKAP